MTYDFLSLSCFFRFHLRFSFCFLSPLPIAINFAHQFCSLPCVCACVRASSVVVVVWQKKRDWGGCGTGLRENCWERRQCCMFIKRESEREVRNERSCQLNWNFYEEEEGKSRLKATFARTGNVLVLFFCFIIFYFPMHILHAYL